VATQNPEQVAEVVPHPHRVHRVAGGFGLGEALREQVVGFRKPALGENRQGQAVPGTPVKGIAAPGEGGPPVGLCFAMAPAPVGEQA